MFVEWHTIVRPSSLPSDPFDGSVSDIHTSLAFQLWWSCSTLARVSVSWVRDASSGLTVSQLRVSGPVVWRFVALVLQRQQYQTVLSVLLEDVLQKTGRQPQSVQAIKFTPIPAENV